MKNFLEDIKDSKGYYYIDECYNLNDFVMFIAFIMLTVGLTVAGYIATKEDDSLITVISLTVLSIIFTAPFIAHFLIRTIKIIWFKNKMKKYIENGIKIRGKIVDEIVMKDEKLFVDSVAMSKKFAYRPIIEYYYKGEFVKETSKYSFSNSYSKALSDAKITVHKYKDDFIITELIEVSDDMLNSVYNVRKGNTFWGNRNLLVYNKVLRMAMYVTIFGWLLSNVLNLVFLYLEHFT